MIVHEKFMVILRTVVPVGQAVGWIAGLADAVGRTHDGGNAAFNLMGRTANDPVRVELGRTSAATTSWTATGSRFVVMILMPNFGEGSRVRG